MKPFVKWAGGKTQLLPYISEMLPEQFNTYYEVFVGGGALYFYLLPKKAVLNDYNVHLMNTYRTIQKYPLNLMSELNKLAKNHSEEQYYEVRETYNKMINRKCISVKQASRFIYLNKAGYNGLYRLNSQGFFNVPSAKRKAVKLYDKENILDIFEQLNKDVKLLTGDFEEACCNCEENDFVFFDSPYYNTFDTYQAGGFSEEDHIRLRDLFVRLTNKKVKCMLTNSNEERIRELYSGFNIRVVDVKRMINCDGQNRKGQELIITNY